MRAGEEALDQAQACSWDCDGLFTYKKKRNEHELLANSSRFQSTAEYI
jgi:hypothetical protein